MQSISEKRLCSIREASKLIKDSLCSNVPSLNQDNLVAHKNCLSKYTSKIHIDRHFKENLVVNVVLEIYYIQRGTDDKRYQNSNGYSIVCSVGKTVTSM